MKISDLQITEGKNDPHIFKAVFLVGGPGSGKSYVGKKIIAGSGLKYVNLDTFFEMFAKKKNVSPTELLANDYDTLKRSGELSGKQQSLYAEQRLGMLIDGTGRNIDRIFKSKRLLEILGYSTIAVFVNTSEDVAITRNANRERSVSVDFLKQAHGEVRKNLGAIQNEFKDVIIIDNDSDGADLATDWKKIQKFINGPLTYRAQEWIKNENK